MDEKEKSDLLQILKNQSDAGYNVTPVDLIKAKIDLEVAESQIRSAAAAERNVAEREALMRPVLHRGLERGRPDGHARRSAWPSSSAIEHNANDWLLKVKPVSG